MTKPAFSVRLQIFISTIFLFLVLPSFVICASYVYTSNYAIYRKHAADLIDRHNNQAAGQLMHLLDPIRDSLVVLKKRIKDPPGFIDGKELRETLLLHLDNNPDLVSIFVAYENGNFRQVQRIRSDMVVAGRVPPAEAASNYWTVDRVAGKEAMSVFVFQKPTGEPIDSFSISNRYDPRERPFYKNLFAKVSESRESGFIFIDEPFVSTSTRKATLTLSTPIVVNGKFIGMIGESFEIKTIAEFLKSIEVSKNSQTYVIDSGGRIVVGTGTQNGYAIRDNVLLTQNLGDIEGVPAQIAFRRRSTAGNGVFEFESGMDNSRYLAKFISLPNEFKKDWAVLTLVPLNDLLADLDAINQRLVGYGLLLCFILVILSYLGSKVVAKPIERLAGEIRDLHDFKVHESRDVLSRIREIALLSDSIRKLKAVIMAFTSYVPRDLVIDLLKSDKPIAIGSESRYLTMLFSDLKDFSTLAEMTPSRELVECVSSYLELVSHSIKEEDGTVDKFIGDSVMAFWGAPILNQHHAYHACVAAVKSQRRIVELNSRLTAEGRPPLVARIGVHSDAVLVGNIGSMERLSYTVMGDGVNVASRLEGINKDYGTKICVSHAVFKEAGERLWTRPIDHITVKGRKGTILIYELMGIRNGDGETCISDRDKSLCLSTRKAFDLLAASRFEEAASAYQSIVDEFDDSLARVMRDICLQREGDIACYDAGSTVQKESDRAPVTVSGRPGNWLVPRNLTTPK